MFFRKKSPNIFLNIKKKRKLVQIQEQPLNVCNKTLSHSLSHSNLLPWVIHSDWIVHKLHVSHLQSMKRRVISLYSLAHSTSGILTCLSSNNLVLFLKQSKETRANEKWNWKIFLTLMMFVCFHVFLSKENIWPRCSELSDAASKTNTQQWYKEKISVISRRSKHEGVCLFIWYFFHKATTNLSTRLVCLS